MKKFTAGANDTGVRLSRFVLRVTNRLPNSVLHKSFRAKRVKVNGKAAKPDTRLAEGDFIQLYLNDEYFPAPTGGESVEANSTTNAPPFDTYPAHPENQNTFSVVYEDENIAILYKPVGLLSHSDAGGEQSLLSVFTDALTASGEYDPAVENTFSPALCNRLDRGTEGLVIAAKRYAALRDVNELIRARLVQKQYLCITLGSPPKGEHRAWLARNRSTKTVTVSPAPTPGAKEIVTRVAVMAISGSLALCRVELITGRTHQIRAHLAFLGAPLLGDRKYGDVAANRRFAVANQALCAWKLHFGELPAQNTLVYLAGKSFEAKDTAVQKTWVRLAGHPGFP